MYNNFIFDLYGTLIDIRTDEWSKATWKKYAGWLKTEGIRYSARKVKKRYDELIGRQIEELKKQNRHEYPEPDVMPVFAAICRDKRPDYTDEEVYKAAEQFRIISTEFVKLYPNTLKVLKELREAGKKIYLLSNAQRAFTWQELESTGLVPYFDDIFISSDEGCKKPDKDFFNALIKKHGLDVKECIMVGNDGSSDIAGAAAAGMDAAYIRTAISPENEPVPECKYVFLDGDIGHIRSDM